MNAKMMHDAYAKMDSFFYYLKDLSK